MFNTRSTRTFFTSKMFSRKNQGKCSKFVNLTHRSLFSLLNNKPAKYLNIKNKTEQRIPAKVENYEQITEK